MTRLVVIGEDGDGRSRVVSDGAAEERSLRPVRDLRVGDVWGADARVAVPTDGTRPPYTRFFPPAEGFRVMLLHVGPEGGGQADGYDVEAYQRQREAALPGYFEDARVDDRGSELHRTDTVDVAVVLEGEIELELDDGAAVTLAAGDLLVQNGARHAWHNRSDAPCTLAVFVVGADAVAR